MHCSSVQCSSVHCSSVQCRRRSQAADRLPGLSSDGVHAPHACRTGAYFRHGDPLRVLHWWYVPKPWMVGSHGDDVHGVRSVRSAEHENIADLVRAYAYLSRSSMLSETCNGCTGNGCTGNGCTGNMSPCVRALWTMRRAIEDDPRFDTLSSTPSGLGITVPYQPLRARVLRV